MKLKDSTFLSFLCYIMATPLKILCKISPWHFSSMIANISGSCIINTHKAHICPVSCTQNISEEKWRLCSTYAGSSFPVQMWELEEMEMYPGWTSRISEEDCLSSAAEHKLHKRYTECFRSRLELVLKFSRPLAISNPKSTQLTCAWHWTQAT